MAAALVVASGLVEHTAGGLSTSSSACASRIKAAAAAAASNDAAAGPEKACLICMAGRETLSHGAKVSGNGNPMADAVLSCVEKLQDDRFEFGAKLHQPLCMVHGVGFVNRCYLARPRPPLCYVPGVCAR